MTFDTSEARRYGNRELRPDDSYHAHALLEACDEIDRLRQEIDRLQGMIDNWRGTTGDRAPG